MVCSQFLGEQWGIQHPPSCPACPSPGLVSLGETVTVVPNCAASSWCQSGQGPGQDTQGERCHTEGDPTPGRGCGRAAPAGSGAPGWAPPASPTQTKYPALWLSEKFLALAWPGLSGFKSPSSMEPGLLSALSPFFLFLTPGAQADWQTYPSMEGRTLALGSSQEVGGSASQRPRTDMESETVWEQETERDGHCHKVRDVVRERERHWETER